MKFLKTAAAWLLAAVLLVLWSEHCYQRGAAAATEQCEFEAEYDPGAHIDV